MAIYCSRSNHLMEKGTLIEPADFLSRRGNETSSSHKHPGVMGQNCEMDEISISLYEGVSEARRPQLLIRACS